MLSRLQRSSAWTKVNVVGLVFTAGGMLVQIAGGSDLYPSLSGPIVLLGTAVLVALGPGWTRWAGLGVPLVLGVGAFVAAIMTGAFTDQLTATASTAIFAGSWLHVIGLLLAIGSGSGALLDSRGVLTIER